jgi:hypothetical protein
VSFDEIGALLDQEEALSLERAQDVVALRVQVAELQAQKADLEAKLAACLDEPGPTPGLRRLAGWWASGAMEQDVAELEAMSDTSPAIVRTRGGEGEFDDPWLKPDALRMANKGYIPSLQIQPKTGSGSQRRGVGVERILTGAFDATIRAGMNEWKQLPAGMRFPCEIVSEANIQQAPVEAQPYLAGYDAGSKSCKRQMTADEFAALLRYLDEIARNVGVRDRMVTCVSLAGKKWGSTQASDPWSGVSMRTRLQPLVDDGVVDIIAVDGYCGGRFSSSNTPAVIGTGVKKIAKDLGVPWAVMETGVVGTAAFKAKWYRDWLPLLDDNCYAFVQNVTQEQGSPDLDFRPWVPTGAIAGFNDLMAGLGQHP